MGKKTWEQLQQEGWKVRPTKKPSYERPPVPGSGTRGTIVYQKRNLTQEEKAEFGEVLFPGKARRLTVPAPDISSAPVPLSVSASDSPSHSHSDYSPTSGPSTATDTLYPYSSETQLQPGIMNTEVKF